MSDVDVVIVGGGPAGLSAALMLGRCRRRVLLVDAGEQRNLAATATHGLLTRDGASPRDLLRVARAELDAYASVTVRGGVVTDVSGAHGSFKVRCEDGTTVVARRLLLATGVIDVLPEIEGVRELFGRGIHHCPHCDGFEYSGRPMALYGRGRDRTDAAIALGAWTDELVLLTDGAPLASDERERCKSRAVRIREERVTRFRRAERGVCVDFASGAPVEVAAVFISAPQRQRSDLAARLGCAFTPQGAVLTDEHEVTSVPGLYVAGDASHREQMISVAIAEGAMAAVKIHDSLWREDCERAAR